MKKTLSQRFLILGGTGNAGRIIAELLLKQTSVRLTLCARTESALRELSEKLNSEYPGSRVQWAVVDVADSAELERILKGIQLVVVASGTADLTDKLAAACLVAGTDYLDIQYSSEKLVALKKHQDAIVRGKRLFITEAGFHPGLPAALIRRAAEMVPNLATVMVGGVLQADMRNIKVDISTAREFAGEIARTKMRHFIDGNWRDASLLSSRDLITMDVGEPFGKRMMMPMYFPELEGLPEQLPDCRRLGFYMAGLNWLIDYVVFPLVLLGLKLFPKSGLTPLARFLMWSWSAASRPPFGIILQTEATGSREGTPLSYKLRLSHPDGYWFTAIPVVACLMQYLEGQLPESGLWLMGHIVEPGRLLDDMRLMGIDISETGPE